ncbi:hypothetical protein SAMN05216489_01875 [Streptomyces sp. 3213]|uniref:hypothetical protein n=1 Tax=Streptomyces sp. 3213.3 TaxID=1855348 RepID=UPI00089989BA|nr:hypothetical protein [Streptomyces sp. 3213.3]SEC88432.1 hypothetical protein SAMN05216489_01875 [Streptomyces sp. 3213] [Streptomyces sp. 3213.3]
MALSKIASDFAREISNHDWTDAPYRRDRAGHSRITDTNRGDRVLTDAETEAVRTNVMWVTAQVLGYRDPNFDVYEFAEACGVNTRNYRGDRDGTVRAGIREQYGRYARPGSWEFDPEFVTTETSDFYHRSIECDWFRRGYRGGELLTFPLDGEVPSKWKPCANCVAVAEA